MLTKLLGNPYKSNQKIPKAPLSSKEEPWGFFDGVSQGLPGMYGAGRSLNEKENHYSLSNMQQVRQQTIERNFMPCGFHFLLKIASDRGLSRLQVMGDSKPVIGWTNGKNLKENLTLTPILNRIREVKRKFSVISFTHI